MILLDTNYLIRGLLTDSDESATIARWLTTGERLITSAVVWYEFQCGPVSPDQIEFMRGLLTDGVRPFDAATAAEAARLFNATGRIRALRVDSMIAASAILANAPIATSNRQDFAPFLPHGLQLQ